MLFDKSTPVISFGYHIVIGQMCLST